MDADSLKILTRLFQIIAACAFLATIWCSHKTDFGPYRIPPAQVVALQMWSNLWTKAMLLGLASTFAFILLATAKHDKNIGKILFFALIVEFFLDPIGLCGPHSYISSKNACIINLRHIDGAKEQWAYETKANHGAACPASPGAGSIQR